jgi:membrane-associated phospholipid phosphatase
MAATVISHYYPKSWIPAYLTASLIGVSRLEKNKHYLSDIVAGATLGYIVGRTVVGNTDALRSDPQVTWMPFVSGEDARGLSVWVRF